jgi:SanA protein
MLADLVNAGVPRDRIVMDYAGFRTLDSILRCRDVFGERAITIISQPFHNARALFIANRKDMQAIAFNAKDVGTSSGFKTLLREKLARVKMVLDLLFGKEPKFYGPHISIG